MGDANEPFRETPEAYPASWTGCNDADKILQMSTREKTKFVDKQTDIADSKYEYGLERPCKLYLKRFR